ncbi:hypothetical protein CMV_004715 [Castanea mollissima]|uniref:Uncharacterized protein n=1 Tax=Castanea mollissima TaxID=60419 RepID=A0A8J4W228_9ROSI|nr:hypothetical protein CMV_004715 [Castanea mollissima]
MNWAYNKPSCPLPGPITTERPTRLKLNNYRNETAETGKVFPLTTPSVSYSSSPAHQDSQIAVSLSLS